MLGDLTVTIGRGRSSQEEMAVSFLSLPRRSWLLDACSYIDGAQREELSRGWMDRQSNCISRGRNNYRDTTFNLIHFGPFVESLNK